MLNLLKNNFRLLFAAMFLLSIAATTAYSRVPESPDSLTGRAIRQGGVQYIQLTWRADIRTDSVLGFNIYMAQGQSNNPTDFRNILNERVKQNNGNFFGTNLTNLPAGTYTFYVTAYNREGESGPSNLCYVTSSDQSITIRFTSEPVRNALIEQEYTYTAQAEASNDGTVKYRLNQYPSGMTIDEDSGVITWTPAERGAYNVVVTAYLANATEVFAKQNFDVYVLSCENPATLSGMVYNSDGEPLGIGMAYLYSSNYERDSLNKFGQYYTSRISDGEFFFQGIDEGTFYLQVQGQNVKTTWYENATSERDATPIVIECGDETTLEMTLPQSYNNVKVNFTSIPPTVGKVNEEITYTAEAEASNAMEVTLSLEKAPDGATFNTETGVLSWTPTQKGTYAFSIRATLNADPTRQAVQTFHVKVSSCDILSSIAGTVSYENGSPVAFGTVYAYTSNIFIDSNGVRYGKDPIVTRVLDGAFQFTDLDEGSYYLQFMGQDFYSEWWEDKAEHQNADAIELECNENITISVVVTQKPVQRQYKVSGTVYAQEDNSPLAYIPVEFIGTEANTGTTAVFRTHSSQNGVYSITLADNYSYIARAVPLDSSRNMPPQNYLAMYYNQKTDPTEADVITLTGNLTGIDFYLEPRETYDNSIYGSVLDENGNALENVWVVAYLVEDYGNNRKWLYRGKSGYTNESGEYVIQNLIPGEYILMAYTNSRDYVPGYYLYGEIAAQSWQNATRIEVGEQGENGSYTIMLAIRQIVKGNGRLDGYCGRRGGIIKSDGKPQGNDAVAGALVFVNDKFGKTAGWSISGPDGAYSVADLPLGQYTVVVDKVGFTTVAAEEELDENRSNKSKNFDLKPMEVTSVDLEIGAVANVYPNPATESITVAFEAKQGATEITLINALGRIAMKNALNAIDGLNTASANVSGLSPGLYYLKIENAGKIIYLPLTIAK